MGGRFSATGKSNVSVWGVFLELHMDPLNCWTPAFSISPNKIRIALSDILGFGLESTSIPVFPFSPFLPLFSPNSCLASFPSRIGLKLTDCWLIWPKCNDLFGNIFEHTFKHLFLKINFCLKFVKWIIFFYCFFINFCSNNLQVLQLFFIFLIIFQNNLKTIENTWNYF